MRLILSFLYFCCSACLFGEISTEEAFSEIYKNKIWGTNEDGEGHSGYGSTLAATEFYRGFLQDFLKIYNIKSVIDAGCGDWEFSKFMNWEGIQYLGYDVVSFVIEKNKALFETSNIYFIHGDFTQLDLPSVDLLICKDVLMHLPNATILKFLEQLPKFKYCLFVNDVHPLTLNAENRDIVPGDFRPLSLSSPPFSLNGTSFYYSVGSVLKEILIVKGF